MASAIPQADVIVVGSGPNGLAAAIEVARAGRSVVVIEGADQIGGGTRTQELTQPGFRHDVCAAIHPMGVASPFLCGLPLQAHGLEWIHPDAPLAHPLDDGTAVVLERSVEATAAQLGDDAEAYRELFEPLVEQWEKLAKEVLAPLHVPSHPLVLGKFAMRAVQSTTGLAEGWFRGERARALLAGVGAHSILPLEQAVSGAFSLLLTLLGHAVGWPIPCGGSQRIAEAMAAYLRSLGGRIVTGRWVQSLEDLPPARAVMLDVMPRSLLRMAGERLEDTSYREQLETYRHGPGVFKVDWALDGPIPWKAAACARAGTVHVGGPMEEIAASEKAAWEGRLPERPFLMVAQQSLFDDTRAPAGRHTGWAYCHVPNGSTADMTDAIERQIERFAPGFRDRIVGRHTMNSLQYERYNPNLVGGDINGGTADMWQLLKRPALRWSPYRTPLKGVYLCSSATPPGGGVHGMCGYHAAKDLLEDL